MYSTFSDPGVGDALSRARGSSWMAFPSDAAFQLLAALQRVAVNIADLTAFIAAEHGPETASEEAEAVQAALSIFQGWLAQVAPRATGLLSIG